MNVTSIVQDFLGGSGLVHPGAETTNLSLSEPDTSGVFTFSGTEPLLNTATAPTYR